MDSSAKQGIYFLCRFRNIYCSSPYLLKYPYQLCKICRISAKHQFIYCCFKCNHTYCCVHIQSHFRLNNSPKLKALGIHCQSNKLTINRSFVKCLSIQMCQKLSYHILPYKFTFIFEPSHIQPYESEQRICKFIQSPYIKAISKDVMQQLSN